jgi:hypothetical protein
MGPLVLGSIVVACAPDETSAPGVHDTLTGTFTGTYTLQSVDGTDLPTVIITGFNRSSMSVQHGALTFDGSSLRLAITGPLNGGASPITLGTGATYSVTDTDSLQSSNGVGGRVWKDSATLNTGPFTLAGTHWFRFVRSADP